MKEKDCPPGTLVKLCFSSDFFLEEADEWREGCWDAIRRHPDCTFVLATKTLRVEACSSSAPSRSSASWRPCTPRRSPPAVGCHFAASSFFFAQLQLHNSVAVGVQFFA